MAKTVSVRIDDELYERLVSVTVKRYGAVRGGLQKAVREAIEEYVKRCEHENRANTERTR